MRDTPSRQSRLLNDQERQQALQAIAAKDDRPFFLQTIEASLGHKRPQEWTLAEWNERIRPRLA